ncbi:U3 small nucleolar ribonucleoprotein complex subunit Mpp10p [Penicillium waksmanii]|uniref:U3 small nucleolar ribonucleoprotein complex subunit Mpp10p n=1 Tax=Penicillium waksmanii TaxID=69791 RepID=UPI0025498607|nr:U3 small nucleolar ribonucleoprotein complex subunit Mpp10p [Penicillium waksmanii]KAJ5966122.1 U3 small nucleolar ribonucleoprotein complex subunit Mpp10p [Penicillium waksmanii]
MAKRKNTSDAATTVTPATTTKTDLPSALSTPWSFLQPSGDLHALLADSAKQILDPLATSVVDEQTARKQLNKKRKRSEEIDAAPPLQLKNLYVDGFTSNQVWEQATRILESAGAEIQRDVALIAQFGDLLSEDEEGSLAEGSGPEELGSESDDAESMSDAFSGEEEDIEGSEAELGEEDELEELEEGGVDDFDAMEEEGFSDEDEEGSAASEKEEEDGGFYTEDKFGLNDGFFSIDDFNKQSEELERQDMKGGADDDDDDEEEEVNWHADPIVATDALPKAKPAPIGGGREDEDMDDDSEEDGPTFGNADLNAADSDDDDVEPDVDPEATSYGDTSNIKYTDFFQAPARKASSKKFRALPKTQPKAAADITQEDVDRAMADVRRDLFDDEDEMGEEGEDMEVDGEIQGPKSTHEKQRAKIADEIRRLEASNVAKKEWTMAGEARAVERPVNSLIEEDLDFERVGKPVPVVTNETSEDIEELIKRRILANEFDEVIRRRPGIGDSKAHRRARFELADTKPQESLAEMYEAEHQRANDPNYVDTKDKKLMREHAEIQNLWKEVSAQLDTLCNWHYTPKAPQANINVVTDAATITMEDARPTAGSAAGGPSALAPQEVYAPGNDGKVAGEVLLKTGASISKDEMSREDKARKRRQSKAQYKSSDKPAEPKGKAAEKQQLVSDLKKGGVKVIDKEGKVTNMDGGKDRREHGNKGDKLKL